MPRCPWLSLLLLTIPLALVARKDSNKNEMAVLRKLKPVNASNANVKQCLWFAMQEYNEESEDKYVFLVVKTLQAQLQVTNRLEYLIDVEIARSDCRKPFSTNEICAIQENSKLKKKLSCSFLVGALPWNGEFTVMEKKCEDA
ncbi:cystatin-8 [Theropithecus gelada]|uniref:Cystatin-8 n=1 Tax=Theropithecus gelada TaxID=9565 RepID=A0A8D2FVI3_THEGE|nr:cystatin-8 [Theropithecus gelada]XP_025255830.1 cystatin-8 [Theropithecus gelada]